MRAAAWATNRDLAAAWVSWERAAKIADALPTDDPNRAAMRIAPRTMLCGIASESTNLSPASGLMNCGSCAPPPATRRHWPSAMAGLVIEHAYQARMREASQLASEAMGAHRVAR